MHPTYKNFDAIAQLIQSNNSDTNSFEFEKISQAMYEYLRTLNITQESFSGLGLCLDPTSESFDGASSVMGYGVAGGPVGVSVLFDDGEIPCLNQVRHCLNKEAYFIQKQKQRKEEKLNYLINHRWDPQWLRSMRSRCCIPFTIIALIFLIFTNFNSNWIRFDSNMFDNNFYFSLYYSCNHY